MYNYNLFELKDIYLYLIFYQMMINQFTYKNDGLTH